MFRYFITALLVFAIYILFAGSISLYTILTGVALSSILSAISTKYLVKDEHKVRDARRFTYLLYYFLKYMSLIELRAHMDVVKRIFTMNLKPGIVKVPVEVSSKYARLLVMGSITNTPGTVVIDERDGYFYVNWIDVTTDKPEIARKYISEEFEHYARKIFE